ncbi:efflux transporter outer membrane subunit [Chitiniphilus eburneus]|uniref:Efflux transporter outer membrane subunit n=1 Tax=Chitiniphilus eburneus TaxID=2571148 RepID=A0A4U0PMN2_9NEIS|nr:efflux transporter outer membrane subunit [Chitiniphilus eburneus]TJZ69355.1 efflux transporter outer membrane subunit [Chitiniphilus eburneus]
MRTRLIISWRAVVGGAALLALTGCALIRDEPPAMAAVDPARIRLAEDIKLAREGWPEAQWWQRYQDPQLDALIATGQRRSPRMAIARAQVEAARAQTRLTHASGGLLLGLVGSISRQSPSENGYLGPFAKNEPALGLDGPWYTGGTLALEGSYEFDLWGKHSAQTQAALGIENARLAEAAQAELWIAAQIAQVYFDIQSLYAARDLLRQSREIEREMLAAHTARAERGLEPRTQVELTRIHVLELDKQMADVESKLKMLEEAMRPLLGAGADDLPEIAQRPLPPQAGAIPATLGYELLARRADLQAMRWSVQASLSGVDAARAAFYPTFDIKVFFGLDSLHLDNLLERSSRQIQVVPGLTLPLFDSGRLNANLASARSSSNLTIAQYNAAVVDAVRQVAHAGVELQGLQQQADIQDAKLAATRFASDSAVAHYQRGLADKVLAMESRLPVLYEQGQQLALRSRQLNAEIALTLALGGGYRVADDAHAPAP